MKYGVVLYFKKIPTKLVDLVKNRSQAVLWKELKRMIEGAIKQYKNGGLHDYDKLLENNSKDELFLIGIYRSDVDKEEIMKDWKEKYKDGWFYYNITVGDGINVFDRIMSKIPRNLREQLQKALFKASTTAQLMSRAVVFAYGNILASLMLYDFEKKEVVDSTNNLSYLKILNKKVELDESELFKTLIDKIDSAKEVDNNESER